jgi:fructosamine-3-kinase
LTTTLADAVAHTLGAAVTEQHAVSGGDINLAYRMRLADGRTLFVKTRDRAPHDFFRAEAHGLQWLTEADVLRVPEVLAVADAPDAPSFLALEWIEPGGHTQGFDEALGRGLAALHRDGPPEFGLERDNFIGSLPQRNDAHASWPEFYVRERLEPQLAMAVDQGRASSAMQRGFERLFARIEDACGPSEPAARLHGDLWGGNLLCDANGAPCLIDPAVYGGHREIDLAMMRLFGGFGARTFAAYDEAWPLSAGHEERVALYQLYPLMVHVNLFGGGYAGQVESVLRRL